jgi:hypothetical protein
VLGNFVSQIFFDEATNNTVLATPAYARSTGRDTTNASDMVYRVANPERMLATTTGDLSAGYPSTITIGASLPPPAATAPSVSAGRISNAASGAAGLAPNAWISIYGSSLATTERILASSDLVNNTLATLLGGVSVQINGKAAYLSYVSPARSTYSAPLRPASVRFRSW